MFINTRGQPRTAHRHKARSTRPPHEWYNYIKYGKKYIQKKTDRSTLRQRHSMPETKKRYIQKKMDSSTLRPGHSMPRTKKKIYTKGDG